MLAGDMGGGERMTKTPLQVFKEMEQRKSCLTCENLITKTVKTGKRVNFCGYCGKIILDRFLDCGNLKDCDYKRKEVEE